MWNCMQNSLLNLTFPHHRNLIYFYLIWIYCFYSFRDQNFGLNELAAIQDVRNEYNLQDITDEPPSSSAAAAAVGASATTNDRGK